jgi:uncharacterized protein
VNVRALAVDFGTLFVELLVLLYTVSAGLALAARRLGLVRLQRWLGGGRWAGAVKGAGVGFVLPFCTYSAIPVFVAMVEARARAATLAGFLLAAPLLDPVVLAVLVLLFGWSATLAYAAVTAVTVLVLALVADRLQLDRLLRAPTPARAGAATATPTAAAHPSCRRPDPFGDVAAWRGAGPELRAACSYALGLVRSLLVPMLVAVAGAAAIVGLVPDEFVARIAGPSNPLAVPAAALLGAPFYVSTEAFLPIASALHVSGMGIGAVFALVVSAAGVNLPELTLLSRFLRPRLLVTYTAAVVGVAVAAGYLVPLVL